MTKAFNNIGQLCPVSSHKCAYKMKTNKTGTLFLPKVRDNSIPGSFLAGPPLGHFIHRAIFISNENAWNSDGGAAACA